MKDYKLTTPNGKTYSAQLVADKLIAVIFESDTVPEIIASTIYTSDTDERDINDFFYRTAFAHAGIPSKTYLVEQEFRAYADDDFIDRVVAKEFTDKAEAIAFATDLNRTVATAWEALPNNWEYTCFIVSEWEYGDFDHIVADEYDCGFQKPSITYENHEDFTIVNKKGTFRAYELTTPHGDTTSDIIGFFYIGDGPCTPIEFMSGASCMSADDIFNALKIHAERYIPA